MQGATRPSASSTLGGGGTDLVALDATRIPKPDSGYDYKTDPPVKILWTKTTGASSTGNMLEQLQQTFSIPAMAPASSNTWRLVAGSGFNPGNTATNQTKALVRPAADLRPRPP